MLGFQCTDQPANDVQTPDCTHTVVQLVSTAVYMQGICLTF